MLTMIHGRRGDPASDSYQNRQSLSERVTMKEAAWPVPFTPGLEYNSAAHGTWNIVHTGMLLPGAHQIYVCADNCNRGVVLTAAEMNASDRFSFIGIREEDLYSGEMEEIVIEGVADILRRLPRKPTAVLLFTVCLHHFMGCDIPYIYEELRTRFPDQDFIECYMDPIMQKEGLTPDQKLRASIYDCIRDDGKEADRSRVNLLGSDFALDRDSEIYEMVREAGCRFLELPSARDYEEYLAMGAGFLNLCIYPPGFYGASRFSERLGRECLYLPACFGYEEITRQLDRLAEALGREKMSRERIRKEIALCEEELEKTRSCLGHKQVAIDASAVPRLLGLTRLLVSHGISVKRIFADAFSPEEEEDYLWLKDHAPEMEVCGIIHHNMRVFPRGEDPDLLAIGQKAAYFQQTPHFVNIVQGAGFHGFEGIRKIARLIREAAMEEKDTRDLVVRKGLGCESCI